MTDKLAEKPRQHAEEGQTRIKKEEDEVTIASEESFPAGDTPSYNPWITGPGNVKKKKH